MNDHELEAALRRVMRPAYPQDAQRVVDRLLASDYPVESVLLSERIALKTARLFEAAGLPPGVINMVTGDYSRGASGFWIGSVAASEPRDVSTTATRAVPSSSPSDTRPRAPTSLCSSTSRPRTRSATRWRRSPRSPPGSRLDRRAGSLPAR